MATSLPKKEIVVQNRIDDNSFPQIPWKVERKGNDGGRLPQPCLSCAGATDQGINGYDEDYELENKFQMFSGLERFEGADDEADMFLDEDLEPFGVPYDEEEAFEDGEEEAFEDGDILFEEESAPIESFFPEEYASNVRCPPPPGLGCGHCDASPCACKHRHMQRCGLASLALFVALIAIAAILFKRK